MGPIPVRIITPADIDATAETERATAYLEAVRLLRYALASSWSPDSITAIAGAVTALRPAHQHGRATTT